MYVYMHTKAHVFTVFSYLCTNKHIGTRHVHSGLHHFGIMAVEIEGYTTPEAKKSVVHS